MSRVDPGVETSPIRMMNPWIKWWQTQILHASLNGSQRVLPKFGSEPKFEPEPLGLSSKFISRFRIFAELNLRSKQHFMPLFGPRNVRTSCRISTTATASAKNDMENSSRSRGEALAGARDVICLKPFGTFFFLFTMLMKYLVYAHH